MVRKLAVASVAAAEVAVRVGASVRAPVLHAHFVVRVVDVAGDAQHLRGSMRMSTAAAAVATVITAAAGGGGGGGSGSETNT